MDQTEFNAGGAGDSQEAIILRRLLEARGAWVALPELARISGSAAVHSRAAGIRSRGFIVHQASERKGRKVHSFYRIPVDTNVS